MITETSSNGDVKARAKWMDQTLETVASLRAQGIPIIGYTWFPLFTMVDWKYRFGRGPLEEYYLELGLYTLQDNGAARWRPTPLVEQFRSYVSTPDEAIGTLGSP